MKELEKLRRKIDLVDEEILRALNERAKIVLEVARIKRDGKFKYHDPERERQLISRLEAINKGPFPNMALKPLYREIISACLSLEEPLKAAYLGPLATFTNLAALRHFGSSTELLPIDSIKGVFDAVEADNAVYGVVPIENSNEGMVTHTLDLFVDYDLKVAAEIMLEVSHNLLSKDGEKGKVKRIYSHPHAAAQCRRWLEANMPLIPVAESSSTARAAELAAGQKGAAAISSELAASVYDLKFIEKHIEDNRNNYTRFLVVAKACPPPTENDKTSIMFSAKDKPGALYNVLSPFKKAKINLTKIESRPSKRKAWEYIFFVDMEGHMQSKKVKKALDELSRECLFLKILGSYPRGD